MGLKLRFPLYSFVRMFFLGVGGEEWFEQFGLLQLNPSSTVDKCSDGLRAVIKLHPCLYGEQLNRNKMGDLDG